MIVCHCVGVTDGTIRKLIEAGASSVGEITRRCGAGRCCPPCREEIASLLHGYAASRPPAREFAAADCA
jgi:bacterioferritin-associated ferredoxin